MCSVHVHYDSIDDERMELKTERVPSCAAGFLSTT